MPLIPPRLDDRSFDGLVSELIARIPAHTPEWTNPRVGDPGRTLIELFAWLADTILYRANLIPERQRLVFLKLLGIQMRPALPARGIVTLSLAAAGVVEPTTLRVGARVLGPPSFETLGELTVLPIRAQVYVKARLSAVQQGELGPVVRELTSLYNALRSPSGYSSRDDAPHPSPYVTTTLFSGAISAQGFDFIDGTVDQTLWFALLAPEPSEESVRAARNLFKEGRDGRPFTLNVGFAPAVAPVEALEELPALRPIAHVWEVTTAELRGGEPVYRALDVLADTTQGLRRNGVLQLALAVGELAVPSNDLRKNPLAGVSGDSPPRIDDAETAARLITWLRLRPVERLNSLAVTWSGINAVQIEQTRTFRNVVIGQGNGTANQTIPLPAAAVAPASLQLQVEEGERGFQRWQLVEDTTAYGRDARVYALDAEAGSIRFGDGVRGRLPEPGARVRVLEMKAGGGQDGNLAPGTLKSVHGEAPSGVAIEALIEVAQPLPTRGGVHAETLAEAETRIPAVLRHRNRALTKDDFVSLAAATPGLNVGRVEVLPRFKPHQRRENVPGVVSVMMLPAIYREGVHPPAPRPDRPFLETAHAWLDERRALGTELYVIGTEYVSVGVSVGVDIRAGFAQEETLTEVKLALRTFLWPLRPGGVRAAGWELGASVLASQLEVAVARVAGVSAVRSLRLFERVADDWALAPASGSGTQWVGLALWQLPELLSVVAVAGADAPGDLRGVPNPFRGGGGTGGTGTGSGAGIGIPVVPEVC